MVDAFILTMDLTNAETAQIAAELAETNAETAETNAETAQTAAELAETNAETAQAASETARALVNNPKIILADEPTGNLDPEISLKILNLFEKINQEGKTVIFATHSLEMLRAQNHRLLTLNRGKII